VEILLKENKACAVLVDYTQGTNKVLARADQIIRLSLVMDVSDNATNTVQFDKATKRFLHRNVDPIAISDFIEPLRRKVEFANKKFLQIKTRGRV
jgi:hypothetical protein